MPLFTIKSPDGRTIKIKANDEQTALRGAQEWAAANPKQKTVATAPAGMQPGSRDYADWALSQVKAGNAVPQVSEAPEWAPPTAQQTYDRRLSDIRQKYYPNLTDEQWQKSVEASITNLKPLDAGGLLNDGLTAGLSDEARGAAGAITAMTQGKNPAEGFTDFQQFEQARRDLGAEQAGGMGTAAQIGGAVLSGRPDLAAAKAATTLPRIVQMGKDAAKQGFVYGAASTEGDLVDRAAGGASGAMLGGAVGSAVPAVAQGVKKALSPVAGNPAKAKAAQVLASEGVDLTAGQQTGNKNLQYREAELGGAAAEDFMDRQASQFTAAALKRAGMQADHATADVIDAGFSAIGKQFDDLAARNGLKTDPKLVSDLNKAWTRFEGLTNESTRPRFVERLLGDINAKMRTGYAFLDGEWYKTTRSELGRISRSTSNPELKDAVIEIQAALDDAMERTLKATNPTDLGAWKEARRLYRNILVIEDAATRAGAQSADGIITPQALRSAAIRQNKRAYARGKNEFTDLANAGVSTMTPLPNSGTAGRLGAKLFVPAGAATGATIGSMIAPGIGTAAGAAAGAAVPWAAGKLALSGVGRRYLANQRFATAPGEWTSLLGGTLTRGAQPLLPSN